MRHLGIVIGGIMLTCSGCVVHQAVPVAMPPPSETAPADASPADATARNCREFQDTIIVGGVKQPAYGTTCQQPDGSWRITSSSTTSAPPNASAPPTAAAPYPYPYPYPVYPPYPYPYYGYPYGYPYYGHSIGVGFRFGGRWH